MTPDEEQPLLQEPAPEQPEWKKRVYIAASALGGILVLLILLAYNWLIPAQIQEALNGSGTLVNRVHIKSIDGNKTSLLLDLTIPVQPPFTTCYLDQTELEFSVPFDDDDEAVGSFVLPRITAYPKQSKIDLQFESDFVYDDIPLLSYLITQAVKHQIYPKSVQFLGNPRVVVPLLPFGSWAGVLKRVYSSGN
ncbi:hypothetical protein EDD86DRAFT_48186 [Gorgonomyces haynaldii]|nr:hypothetical protein EDD86DRAFT_48186 [Gorgonomyces haynaldii]